MYSLTIGLEVHVKIASEHKLFCACRNHQNFDDLTPNTNICPVCIAQPGALPVLMEDPFIQSLRLGASLRCTIHETSSFDRKSYFYPDLPTGYQITQLYQPTCTDGHVDFFVDEAYETHHRVHIRDAHMEIDTAKTIHHQGKALLDFNRAGTPLVEVVTGPDFTCADQVVAFLKEFQRIVKYNNISDADMEKGQMRVDVNISIAPKGSTQLGTRVELKNINSFTAIKKAIEHEQARQEHLLESGGIVEQETRRRDDIAKQSYLMRSKDDALDYRYFPEPDMPPISVNKKHLEQANTPTLVIPYDSISQMKESYGFHKEYINALLVDQSVLEYFYSMADRGHEPRLIAKWLSGPIAAYCKEHVVHIDRLPFDTEEFHEFLTLVATDSLLDNQCKIVLQEMLTTDMSVSEIVSKAGFDQSGIDEDTLLSLARTILAENEDVVRQYQEGKHSTL